MSANPRTTFLAAAYEVLQSTGRPMTAAEILHAARAGGLIETTGKTSVKTLNARLSVDILRFKLASRFMRSDGSRFALRDWSASVQERIVPRRSIALVDEQILALRLQTCAVSLTKIGSNEVTILI